MSWNWFSSSVCHRPRERGARVGRARASAATRRQQLDVVQQHARPCGCARFDRGLRRVGAAVVLEVQLADDRRAGRAAPPRASSKNASRRALRRARQALRGRARGAGARASSARRPAAAVAVAEEQQLCVRAVVVLVVARVAAQLGDGRLGVVGVGRREVRRAPRCRRCPASGTCGARGLLNAFHDSFWVRKRSMPAPRMICGSWPL